MQGHRETTEHLVNRILAPGPWPTGRRGRERDGVTSDGVTTNDWIMTVALPNRF